MTSEEEFVLGLVLSEEAEGVGSTPDQNTQEPSSDKEDNKEVFFVQREDITLRKNVWFTPRDTDEAGDVNELPLKDAGTLDNFLVIANSDEFRVRVSIDNSDVINNTYTDLASVSNELTHVSAYQKNGDYIVSVTDYPFSERLNTSIRPTSDEVIINRVRTEAVI